MLIFFLPTNFAFLEHISRAIQHLDTRSYIQDLTTYQTTTSRKPVQKDKRNDIHSLPLRQAKTIYIATNLLYHLLQKDFGKSQADMIKLQDMDLQLLAIKEKIATSPDSTYELHSGILYKKVQYKNKTILTLCLPELLCKEVLNKAHSSMGYHFNVTQLSG